VDGEIATIGISDHAQGELGDITYLELPEPGESVSASEPFGIVESVKAASDIFAPIDGEVVERNEAVVDAPDLVNSSPYDKAWLIRLRVADDEQLARLMSAADYDAFAATAGTH
jgi:glycine cleavage system H protein